MNKEMFKHHGSPWQCPICRNIFIVFGAGIIAMVYFLCRSLP